MAQTQKQAYFYAVKTNLQPEWTIVAYGKKNQLLKAAKWWEEGDCVIESKIFRENHSDEIVYEYKMF